jgi:alpha-tubulin suppressor-like RCC1 family protein
MGLVTRVAVLFVASACAAAPETKPVVLLRPIPAIEAGAPASVVSRETISAAGKTTCLVHEGRVLCFGDEVAASPYQHNPSATATPRAIEGITDAIAISVGETTACALRSNGRVSCFGVVDDGTRGEEGMRGGYIPHVVKAPVEIENLDDARAVAAGEGFACVLRRNGTVACFGMNESGELGLAKIGGRLDPIDVGGVAHAQQVVAGSGYACARLHDRTVMCWGNHAAAYPIAIVDAASISMHRTQICSTLGSGDVTCIDMRNGNAQTRKLEAIDAASGEGFACGLHKDGTIACDGDLEPAARDVKDAVAIVAGAGHACALTPRGEARCWGKNDAGQCGEEPTVIVHKPTRVPNISDATRIVMGARGACALRNTRDVACWGDGVTSWAAADATDATVIAGGDARYCSIDLVSKVRCWGVRSASLPVGIDDAIDLAMFRDEACVVRRAGTVSCFGGPRFGTTPVAIAGVRDAVRVFVGYRRSCAIRKNGTAVCWGDDVESEKAKLAEIKDAKDYVEISLGQPDHVRFKNGDVRAFDWGNSFDRGAPLRIAPPQPKIVATSVAQIAQAFYETCARSLSGSVTCWGTSNELVPSGFTDAVDVALTESRAYCVVRTNGEVWCWGENEHGECSVDPHVVVRTPSHVKP